MNDIELKNRSYANRVTPGAVVTFITEYHTPRKDTP